MTVVHVQSTSPANVFVGLYGCAAQRPPNQLTRLRTGRQIQGMRPTVSLWIKLQKIASRRRLFRSPRTSTLAEHILLRRRIVRCRKKDATTRSRAHASWLHLPYLETHSCYSVKAKTPSTVSCARTPVRVFFKIAGAAGAHPAAPVQCAQVPTGGLLTVVHSASSSLLFHVSESSLKRQALVRVQAGTRHWCSHCAHQAG